MKKPNLPIKEANLYFKNKLYYFALQKYHDAAIPEELKRSIEVNKVITKKKGLLTSEITSELSSINNIKATNKEKLPIVFGLASIPNREAKLKETIASIYNQADLIHIYLNNYEHQPEFLTREKIKIHRSQEHGDLKDNGKFFGLNETNKHSYYFTIDDDIIYPSDYTEIMIQQLENYSNKCVIGIHGVLYPSRPVNFFDRVSINFQKPLTQDIPCSILGTGTIAFYTGTIKPNLKDFPTTGMADLIFGALCKKNNVPLICTKRPSNWLKEINTETPHFEETLYAETKKSPDAHNIYLTTNAPWGISEINRVLKKNAITHHPDISPGIDFLSKEAHSRTFENIINKSTIGVDEELNEIILTNLQAIFEKANDTLQYTTQKLKIISTITEELKFHKETPYNKKQTTINEKIDKLLWIAEIIPTQLTITIKHLLIYIFQNQLNPQLPEQLFDLGLHRTAYIIFDIEYQHLPHKNQSFIEKLKGSPYLYNHLSKETPHKQNISNAAIQKITTPNNHISQLVQIIQKPYKIRNKKRDLSAALSFLEKIGEKTEDEKLLELLQDPAIDPALQIELVRFWLTFFRQKILSTEEIEAISNRWNQPTSEIEKTLLTTSLQSNTEKFNDPNLITQTLNSVFQKQGFSHILHHPQQPLYLAGVEGQQPNEPKLDAGCSVIISSYNAEKTLQYAYDSICKQSISKVQIIIVDDCSTTPVANHLKINKSIETIILRSDTNLGPYGTRNIALPYCKNEFIAIQDADDWSHPSRLFTQINNIKMADAVCSYTGHLRLDELGRPKIENHGKFIGHGPMTSLFRREVFDEIGYFDEVPTRGDMEFRSRVESKYGAHRIHSTELITLLALDWHSNSKQKTANAFKQFLLSRYKSSYSCRHKALRVLQD